MARETTSYASQADVITLQQVTKELHARLGVLNERLEALTGDLAELSERLHTLSASHAELADELHGTMNGYEVPEEGVQEDEDEDQRATRVGLLSRVNEIESLVKGRNRSAPTKRNMTDADAERVLTGDAKVLGHKEAGELVGLTYAQVYSCRLEYTFKHVHKKLRDSGWKNPFVK